MIRGANDWRERKQPDFQVDEACVSNQESSDGMQQLGMGRASDNWDIPVSFMRTRTSPEDRRYIEFWKL